MKPMLVACIVLAVAVPAITAHAQGASAQAQGPVVVIGATGLQPPVLQATTADRVIFVNRSGRLVHIEFLGSPSQHRVFQVPGQIWAEFHSAGPHRYVVHFESGVRRSEMHGVVEVGHVPGRGPSLPDCHGLTVEGICLDR